MENEKKIEVDPFFLQLLIGLQNSSWILLGKMMNPTTGKLERNLQQAKITIDTISMLKQKTAGNLSNQEDQMISSILTQLHLNYVDEVKKEDIKPETKAQEEKVEEQSKEKNEAIKKDKKTNKKKDKK